MRCPLTVEYSTELVEIAVDPCELWWDLIEGIHDILYDEQVMRVVCRGWRGGGWGLKGCEFRRHCNGVLYE